MGPISLHFGSRCQIPRWDIAESTIMRWDEVDKTARQIEMKLQGTICPPTLCSIAMRNAVTLDDIEFLLKKLKMEWRRRDHLTHFLVMWSETLSSRFFLNFPFLHYTYKTPLCWCWSIHQYYRGSVDIWTWILILHWLQVELKEKQGKFMSNLCLNESCTAVCVREEMVIVLEWKDWIDWNCLDFYFYFLQERERRWLPCGTISGILILSKVVSRINVKIFPGKTQYESPQPG